jgi:hypothetical protein
MPSSQDTTAGLSAECILAATSTSSAGISCTRNTETLSNEAKDQENCHLSFEDELSEAMRRLPACMSEVATEASRDYDSVVLPEINNLIDRYKESIQSLCL